MCFLKCCQQPPILPPTATRSRQISRILKLWPGTGPDCGLGLLLKVVCCGGANIAYCTASDFPVLSDILTLSFPLPRTMPSVPAAKRTNPSPTSNPPTPNFDSDSDSDSSETHLTSTRTIDARHRRRHTYLTPPTKHIPVKVRQSKTRARQTSPSSAASPPLPAQDRPASDPAT